MASQLAEKIHVKESRLDAVDLDHTVVAEYQQTLGEIVVVQRVTTSSIELNATDNFEVVIDDK